MNRPVPNELASFAAFMRPIEEALEDEPTGSWLSDIAGGVRISERQISMQPKWQAEHQSAESAREALISTVLPDGFGQSASKPGQAAPPRPPPPPPKNVKGEPQSYDTQMRPAKDAKAFEAELKAEFMDETSQKKIDWEDRALETLYETGRHAPLGDLQRRLVEIERDPTLSPDQMAQQFSEIAGTLEVEAAASSEEFDALSKADAEDASWSPTSLLRRTGLFAQRDQGEQESLEVIRDKRDALEQMRPFAIEKAEKYEKVASMSAAQQHAAAWDQIAIANPLKGARRFAVPEQTATVNGNATAAALHARQFFDGPTREIKSSKPFNILLGERTGKTRAGRCFAAAASVVNDLVKDPNFKGSVELVGSNQVDHAFVVVNRANYDPNKPDRGINDVANWGPKAYAIDVWQANQRTGLNEDHIIVDPQQWGYAIDGAKAGKLVSTQYWPESMREQDRADANNWVAETTSQS